MVDTLKVIKEVDPFEVTVYPLFPLFYDRTLGVLITYRVAIFSVSTMIPLLIFVATPPRSCSHLAQTRHYSHSPWPRYHLPPISSSWPSTISLIYHPQPTPSSTPRGLATTLARCPHATNNVKLLHLAPWWPSKERTTAADHPSSADRGT
ncbi:hypothetical protein B296_00000297 [Ensete ventricosum]|uniref:Uncharacterized protein n=1 Tax=Ensete ventricosum TaxID=4639 RepID=A0A427BBA6_ENSVE|nr:hypothetical protein B296_00000297 [Ensete ventricosum]